ncbi:methyltransferase domain-containing protein [Phaeobacter sp.]|uniref:methyltransferase domain-containing protein n=1 Tax=Phaeobacter sp. TaxID=1902409 RepID=UPI0025E33DEC|nr:methyltransferase domain-containing protein [Phaeobacter sp.]
MTTATSNPPQLFDRDALIAHRKRVVSDALFLHDIAREEIEDRLTLVNRSFTNPAVIAPFAQGWDVFMPAAKHVDDAETLDLEAGAHDLVVHAMSLHWANDPVGQLIQCRRALREDGLLLVVMLGGKTLQELRSALAAAETRIMGGLSPRVSPMGEVRGLGGLLQRAGFALPVADVVPLTAHYRDVVHLIRDLRGMGETNALAQRQKCASPRRLFAETEAIYRDSYAAADGRLPASFDLICLTGWSPSETQQKPLRPGSAQARLADALRVPETKLPE